MASGVGSLDSLDLLDLLFDRQDGILRGVELGTLPGTWHEDGVSPPGWGGGIPTSSLGLAGEPHPHALPGSWDRSAVPAAPGGPPRVTGTPW